LTRARRLGIALLLLRAGPLHGQDVSVEYQVKAAFLYNFIRFVEWPPSAQSGDLIVCMAGRNPLGPYFEGTVKGETTGGRPIVPRVILEPDADCKVVFVPRGATTSAYLRAARGVPVLTIGEADDFLEAGGIINFYGDNGKVRFEISTQAAERSQLRLSSRLLRLARIRNPGDDR
jgi:hypothetical protein